MSISYPRYRYNQLEKTKMTAHVRALVLDATPLITQSYTHYQNYAESFYTTPTVLNEIKDEQARKNLETWRSLGTLKLVHPDEKSIERVSAFARLTGDYSVLSANDIHILALEYQLECQLNGGDWRLRQKPGDSLDEINKKEETLEKENRVEEPKKKKRGRRGGKKQREKREQREVVVKEENSKEEVEEPKKTVTFEETVVEPVTESNELHEDFEEGDDDGEWITPDTLVEAMIRDSGEDTSGSKGIEAIDNNGADIISLPRNQVALATGDFAVQNVALQMNMNLMNFMSGLKIKRLRNYMLRCHACFKIFPLPKDGKPKHFCPSCGGQGTLLRCAVSVDAQTGQVTPHLKANFQWNNRGNKYSIASPLSKNSIKKYGKKGFVHNKQNSNHQQDTPLLREDQKEYQQMVKQEEWTRRHNEKVLENWIGGGSADNYMSPFAMTGLKHHSYKVGRGRYANSNKKK